MTIQPVTCAVPLQRINSLQAVGQLAKNSARVVAGASHNMMLNPKMLTRNSLIASTFILVVSRIAIAFQSAKKAKGTPEESYRQKEAIKTTIREAGGWSLTYGFFRGVEYLTRLALRRTFGIERQDMGLGLKDFRHEIGHALKRRKSPFNGVRPIEMVDNYSFSYSQKSRYDKLEPFVEWLHKKLPLSKETFIDDAARKLARMKALYKWVPVIAATLPTILMSGVLLERYTRDHADEMADNVVNKWRVGFDGGKPKTDPGKPNLNSLAFNAYFNRINELQSQRQPLR